MGISYAPEQTPVLAALYEPARRRNSAANTADVLSRSDRTFTSFRNSTLDDAALRIEFEVGGRTLRFGLQGANVLPSWAESFFESLASRWGVGHGWDGYRALPTDPLCAATLFNCLQAVMPSKAAAPTITPLADGGVQAEWHLGESCLEIIVDGKDQPRYYHYDASSEADQEGELLPNVATISNLIASF